MKCGDVYGFRTRQARNHSSKYKYHLYLCVNADSPGKYVFMFISSTGTDDCMLITKKDWPAMEKRRSFINCEELLLYPKSDIVEMKYKNHLSDEALVNLMDHVSEIESMTNRDKDVVIDAILAYLDPKR